MTKNIRVFILGSGFSKSCGYPTSRELFGKLIEHLDQCRWKHFEPYKENCLEALQDLGVDLCKKEEICFENLLLKIKEFSALGKDRKGIYIPLRDVLTETTKAYFFKIQSEESREFKTAVNFIKNINACQRICDLENVIISFNWDLLVEHAAKILNVGHSYGFDGEGILILKPHGSINWIRTANYDGAQILNILTDYDPEHKIKDRQVMIMPGDKEKPNIRKLQAIWEQVEKVLSISTEIIFIGYSFPDYDEYSKQIFIKHIEGRHPNHPKIAVINPCKHDIAKYEKIFRSIDIVEPCAFEFSRYV